jgi:hypothetical protein
MNQTIRVRDTVYQAGQPAAVVQEIYADNLDVAVIRSAFPKNSLAAAAQVVDTAKLSWNRPNLGMPGNDIYILGTDTPATPTYTNPRGATLEAYLTSASTHSGEAHGIFASDFDIETEIRKLLGRLSGGLPVELATATDGRQYVPYTLRRLGPGQEISLHHDYYYQMALYSDLAPYLDHATLLSFFLTVQKPESGGELVLYSLRSDDPSQPRLPGGRWNSEAIQNNYPHAALTLDSGDFIVLASGRYFHRVQPVTGTRSRITLGGFLGLTKDHARILYWS